MAFLKLEAKTFSHLKYVIYPQYSLRTCPSRKSHQIYFPVTKHSNTLSFLLIISSLKAAQLSFHWSLVNFK